ncbi:MAG: ParB N-terminal domain-containing protein [Candidatus Methanomethylicia archaeon]
MKIKIADIDVRFVLRDEISNELRESIQEHGVLIPLLVLKLDEELKKKLNTDKEYVCIDGYSRISCLPENAEVECTVLEIEEVKKHFKTVGNDLGLLDMIPLFILRLHACRSEIPKSAYVRTAENLINRGFGVNQTARLLGIPKSTLKLWLTKSKLSEHELEASAMRQTAKRCIVCGKWVKGRIEKAYLHPECVDVLVKLANEDHDGMMQIKGGENSE